MKDSQPLAESDLKKASIDKQLEVLHDHYKDTFMHVRKYLLRRDRLFVYLLIITIIMLFEMAAPKASGVAISQVLKEKLGISENINFSFLRGVIWFLLLGLTLMYYQNVVLIERQYNYLHKLENRLRHFFQGESISREGKAYLTDYPWLSNWAHFLYTIVFPILLVVVVVMKCISEWPGRSAIGKSYLFDLAAAVAVLVTIILAFISSLINLFSSKSNNEGLPNEVGAVQPNDNTPSEENETS